MGLPNEDEVKGTANKAKGAIKENVGRAIDDQDMEAEGKADRAKGAVQDQYGEAKRKTGDAVKDARDRIRK